MAHTRKLGHLSPCVAGGRVPLLAHFFVFLSCLLSFSAFAQTCTEYQGTLNVNGVSTKSGWQSSASSACSFFEGKVMASSGGSSEKYVKMTLQAGDPPVCSYRILTTIPGLDPTEMSGSSFTLEKRAGACKVCTGGAKKTINATIGYHATPSDNLKLNPLVKADPTFKKLMAEGGSTDYCADGCKVMLYAPSSTAKTWVSQVASPSGLYRSSVDLSASSIASPCGESAPDAVSPSATPPTCPGVAGTTASGAAFCLPSAVEDDDLGEAGKPASRGNPTAGEVPPDKTDQERAKGPGGDGNGSGTGGASNGGGASGGPATGKNNTPGGKGCNDGSKTPAPACSGKGVIDADGTTPKPATGKEQAACGAPGQPKCSINETGTPDGKGTFDKAKDGIDKEWDKKKTELDKMMNGDDKDTSWGVTPSWLQSGGCSPWNLGTLPVIDVAINIDICPIKSVVDAVMTFLWALGTFLAVTSMVFRTTTQSGS